MARCSFSDPDAFEHVLGAIVQRAAEQGISEGELARRAGAAPETLSRMKGRRDGPFGLVSRMARIAGLRITVVPDVDAIEALRRGEFF